MSCEDGIYTTRVGDFLDVIVQAGSGYHFFGKFAEKFVMSHESLASKICKFNDPNA